MSLGKERSAVYQINLGWHSKELWMAAILDKARAYPILLCGTPLCFYLCLNLKLLRFLVGGTLLL